MTNAVLPKPREVKIRVHDGVEIAVALYPSCDGTSRMNREVHVRNL